MSLDDENVKCCDDYVVKPVINVPVVTCMYINQEMY